MGSTAAFDAGFEEPLTVAVRGETYRMVGKTPALLVLRGLRAELAGELNQEAGPSLVLEALEASFEPGELDRLLKTGISFEALMGILAWARRRWAGIPEDTEGEAGPPQTGDSHEPSSNDSASSKPTSNGNMGSTSGRLSVVGSNGGASSPFSGASPPHPPGV